MVSKAIDLDDDVDALKVVLENPMVSDMAMEPVRIAYNEPVTEAPIAEDVFIDPRDSITGDGSSLLLVLASAVEALQKSLSKEQLYIDSTGGTLNKCRRDYLREHEYLVQAMKKMAARPDLPQPVVKEIQTVIGQTVHLSRAAAEDASNVVNEDDLEYLVEQAGPIYDTDQELIQYLESAGLGCCTKDELTLRMLLRRIREVTAVLMKERNRLEEVVGPLEVSGGEPDDAVKALLAAAEAEGAPISEVVCAVQEEADPPELKTDIEDLVTKKLRKRHADLVKTHEDAEVKVARWREQLKDWEMRQARIFDLEEEYAHKEQEMAERKRMAEAEEEAERKREQAEEEAERKAKAAEGADDDLAVYKLWGNMSNEDKLKLKQEEALVKNLEKQEEDYLRRIHAAEEEYAEREVRRNAIRQKIADAENEYAAYEETEFDTEERLREAAEQERLAKLALQEMVDAREYMEDEYTASLVPPPKAADYSKIDAELKAAELRNDELREEEARLYAKERLYERRVLRADLAWRAEEEERAAEALLAELSEVKEETVETKTKRQTGDPLLLPYHERVGHPSFKGMDTFGHLATDVKARQRQHALRMRIAAEEEAEHLLAGLRSTDQGAAPPEAVRPQWAPATFRRPEDLRVRHAGVEAASREVATCLDDHEVVSSSLVAELKGLGRQLGVYASDTTRLHLEAQRRLREALHAGGAVEADRSLAAPGDVIRDQLVAALERHRACTDEAEQAWYVAELACERGAASAMLAQEEGDCSRREEELVVASRELYSTSTQAALDAPGPVASHARRCCADFDVFDPQLEAASASRAMAWPRMMQVARDLDFERGLRSGLKTLHKEKEQKRALLDSEIKAPPEAKRALANMRAAMSCRDA